MALELFKIELVIRKKQIDLSSAPTQYLEILTEYRVLENEDKLVVDLPSDWDGLKSGIIMDMFKYFNESLYIALAYLTDDESIIVTDFEGNPVDKYRESINGTVLYKYVKKRLRIAKILDKTIDKFEVKSYILDLKFTEPILNVLSVFSVGRDSGLTPTTFNIRQG